MKNKCPDISKDSWHQKDKLTNMCYSLLTPTQLLSYSYFASFTGEGKVLCALFQTRADTRVEPFGDLIATSHKRI